MDLGTMGGTPTVSFSVEPVKNGAGAYLGSVDKIRIQGVILGSGISFTGIQTTEGNTPAGKMNWKRFEDYSNYLQGLKDYEKLIIKCGTNTIYTSDSIATKIDSVEINNNKDEYWRQFIDYTINISVFNTGAQRDSGYFGTTATTGYFVTNIADSWSVTNDSEHGKYYALSSTKHWPVSKQTFLPLYNITRSISANGIYTSGNSAIENARSCVTGMLNLHNAGFFSMLTNLDIIHSTWQTSIDDINGSFGVEYTILACSGSNNTLSSPQSGWIEDFTVNTTIDQNLKRSVTIAGSVKGFTTRKTTNINEMPLSFNSLKEDANKFYFVSGLPGLAALSGGGFLRASGGFFGEGTFLGVKEYIYDRALKAIAPAMPTGSLTGIKKNKYSLHTGLNPIPLSINIDYDFANESINYNYVFDSRPLNLISGALKENLDMEDSYAIRSYNLQDVYYRMPLPQDLGTYTIPSRSVTYTAVFPNLLSVTGKLPSTMKSQINTVMSAFDPAKLSPPGTVGASATSQPLFMSFLKSSGENYDVLNRTYSLKCSWEYIKGYFPDGFYGGG